MRVPSVLSRESAAGGSPAEGPAAASTPPRPPTRPPGPSPDAARWRFLRSFVRALTHRKTYWLRGNPALWLGFLMGLPLPILLVASNAAPWLIALAIPAPLVWAVVLGAAGRVGILAHEEQQRLEREVEKARVETRTTEKALGHEAAKRAALEQRESAVESELKLAAAVHGTLVPPNLTRPEVEVAVRVIPCQYVGGDYLLASVVEDRWLYLGVADVAGHGIAAALVVARVHGLVRRLTMEKRRPEGILEELNRAALNILQHTYFFMTFAIFRLDLKDGSLEYATAGHPGQFLLRADGRVETLRTPNRLLGMDADIFDSETPSATTRLLPGDTLVLFSDGVFEVPGEQDGEILGETGLRTRIERLRGLSPSLIAGEVLQEIADFQGDSVFEDDVSLMVARYREPAPA